MQLINGEAVRGRAPEKKYRARYLEVLNAAAKLFSAKGYQAATTTHIAEELGIHQASLYYYLKSKEQALEQICEIAIDGYVRFSQAIRKSRQPVTTKLRKLIFMHLITLELRPNFFKVFQENRKDLGDQARHRIGQQIRTYESNVESIIRQGIRAGALRADLNPVRATLALLALCNSVAVWWHVRSDEAIQLIAKDLADIFIKGAESGKAAAKPGV
ncbi:MAG: TetR family transcriptional regulator [Pseudorhodoplanes sp.]|uniref:TetR family transcriptional regulator n=1 Tax=Pseudorhodoplanes sp. TaxID=1934341 RepID=UPI003D109023